MSLLEIKDLCVNFDLYEGTSKVLENVNLSIDKKEFFGLVGETGCGKTMTARAILRMIPKPGRIIRGKILFKGQDILKMDEKEYNKNIRGKKITMVSQDPSKSLNPVFTIGYQVIDIIKRIDDFKDKAKEITLNLFRKTRIASPKRVLRSFPHELSGGMKQRVVISMALSSNAELMILDEPTTALDVTIQAKILNLLLDLKENIGTSSLFITHDLSVIAEVCDKIGIMYAGTIGEVGSTENIFNSPLHPYTSLLLDAIPDINKSNKKLLEIKGSLPNPIDPPSGCRFHPRCPEAMDICKKKVPAMIEAEKGHFVSCFLYGGE